MLNNEFSFRAAVAALLVLGGLLLYRAQHPSTTFAADGLDPAWDAAARRDDGVSRPTVVLFTAEWCPACRMLHDEVLSRGDVRQELQGHYGFHRVDLTNPTQAANSHAHHLGVSGIPTMIRYDAAGNETGRAHYLDPGQMIEWLKAGE